MFRADVGGFDAGSQFSWNVLGAYSFTFAVRNGVTLSGLLGYRALSVDYEKGSGVNSTMSPLGKNDSEHCPDGPALLTFLAFGKRNPNQATYADNGC